MSSKRMENNSIWMKIVYKTKLGNSYDQRVILAYGLSKFTFILMNYLIMTVIGVHIKSLPACLIYLTAIVLLRTYSGGYHAPTKTICFIMTCVVQLIGIFATVFLPQHPWMIIPGIVLLICIYHFSPVEAKNKPLSHAEIIIYKKKTGVICISLMILFILGFYINTNHIVTALLTASFEVFLLMIPEITKK